MLNALLLVGILLILVMAAITALRSGVKAKTVSPVFNGAMVGILGTLLQKAVAPEAHWPVQMSLFLPVGILAGLLWVLVIKPFAKD